MEKILIIQTAFLGDLILSTGFFRGIKEKYPNSHITVLINKGTESILDGNPFLTKLLSPIMLFTYVSLY
jgi:heptosyltransferase-2